MKNYVGICVIGAGRAGMIHAVNFKSSVPNAKIIAIVEPCKQAASAACKELDISKCYMDYKQALDDDEIDAVVIVTPTAYHKKIAIAAAKTGKHILCEKPMAMDENECDEMIQAANENSVKLQVAFMRRFDESFIQAKQIVETGEIGDVFMVRSNTRGHSIP